MGQAGAKRATGKGKTEEVLTWWSKKGAAVTIARTTLDRGSLVREVEFSLIKKRRLLEEWKEAASKKAILNSAASAEKTNNH